MSPSTDTRPVYVVGPPGPVRDRVLRAPGGDSARTFDDVEGFRRAAPEPGLTYLLGDELPAEAVQAAVDHMAGGRGEWTPVLVRMEDGRETVRSISLGYPHALADAAPAGADRTVLLELRAVLAEISRTRHDINNPLTSALAEAQLLLMDTHESEARAAVETVLEQLRRIRDLVAGIVHLRPLD